MGDEIKSNVIKKTQDTLGKVIKRPPLTDKLLRKPPFRFLQDIIITVVRETKFFGGLFTDDEMNSETAMDKEGKMAFLQKVIDVVNLSCGVSLAVRPAKIVAGYEPEKTNELLQIIGRAIEKKVDSSVAVHKVLSKGKGSKETVQQPTTKKSHPKKEEQVKTKKAVQPAAAEKKSLKDKAGSDASKQKASKAVADKGGEDKERKAVATSKDESKKPHTVTKDKKPKKSEDAPVPSSREARLESKAKATVSHREKKSVEEMGRVAGSGKRAVERGRRNSSATANNEANREVIREVIVRGEEGSEAVEEEEEGREEEAVRLPTKKASIDAIDVPEVEDNFASLEPPVSERENVQASTQDPVKGHERQEDMPAKGDGNNSRAGSHKKRQPMSAMLNEELRSAATSVQRVAISTPVVRPSSVMSTATSRPRSSRPHAPRLRSALGGLIPAEEVDAKGGRGVGKGGEQVAEPVPVAGPTGDAAADDVDATEFLVEEARPPLPSTRRVSVGGVEGGTDGKQQGLLVAKILETKKELESGGTEEVDGSGGSETKRVEIEYSEEEVRERRRRGQDKVEGMQCMVQAIARAAHPLGSLLAVLQENVDSMRSETGKWWAESERLQKLLREEEKQMELELEPLHLVLSEVEQRVVEEREAVCGAKARVFKAEQRIHIMLDPLVGGGQVQTARVS